MIALADKLLEEAEQQLTGVKRDVMCPCCEDGFLSQELIADTALAGSGRLISDIAKKDAPAARMEEELRGVFHRV